MANNFCADLIDAVKNLTLFYLCEKCGDECWYITTCNHKHCMNCSSLKGRKKCSVCAYEFTRKDLCKIGIRQNVETIGNIVNTLSEDDDVVNFSCLSVYVKTYTAMSVNHLGESPLFHHCRKRNPANLKLMVDSDLYDINHKDYAGWAPLHEAIQNNFLEGVKILLEAGALPNIPGYNQETPLHKAARLHHKQMCKLLWQFGANPSLRDCKGNTVSAFVQADLPPDGIQCPVKTLYVPDACVMYFTDAVSRDVVAKIGKKNRRPGYSPDVTHIIVDKNETLSVTVLQALVRYNFIFVETWVEEYVATKRVVPSTFECVPKSYPGFMKAVEHKLLKSPPLFEGMCFYLQRVATVKVYDVAISGEDLKRLICEGGGTVLTRCPTPSIAKKDVYIPYHANEDTQCSEGHYYIIYDARKPPLLRYGMKEICHRPVDWIVDCILQFQIL